MSTAEPPSAGPLCALIGDSHLDYFPKGLTAQLFPAGRLDRRACGGARVIDTLAQLLPVPDLYLLSVGSNDSAQWHAVEYFTDAFTLLLEELAAPLVYRSPPGVCAERLGGYGPHAQAMVAAIRTAAVPMVLRRGGVVVDAAALIAPLGPHAFAADGVHLSMSGYQALVPGIAAALAGVRGGN